MTVAKLLRHLGRNYNNVHADIQQLIEWMAMERGDDGGVSVLWFEIIVDMKLPERAAAWSMQCGPAVRRPRVPTCLRDADQWVHGRPLTFIGQAHSAADEAAVIWSAGLRSPSSA